MKRQRWVSSETEHNRCDRQSKICSNERVQDAYSRALPKFVPLGFGHTCRVSFEVMCCMCRRKSKDEEYNGSMELYSCILTDACVE